MDGRFAGRLFLLTGASSGIGRSVATLASKDGARVVAVARNREKLETLAAECSGLVPIVADVADALSMEALGGRVLSELGLPDIILANAGVGLDARFEETGEQALRTLFGVNVLGVFRTVRPFVSGMVTRGSGRILLMSSIVGKRGIPHYSAYSATKFALHGLADALRTELFGSGVSVGLICPGSTETEFQQHALRAGPGQRRVRPLRRSPESVARAVLRMALSRRREHVLGLESKLLVLADSLAPGLVDRLLARMLTRH